MGVAASAQVLGCAGSRCQDSDAWSAWEGSACLHHAQLREMAGVRATVRPSLVLLAVCLGYLGEHQSPWHVLAPNRTSSALLSSLFCSGNLSLQFFSTKYAQLRTGCPPLPSQMRISVSPMDTLPCYENAVPEPNVPESWMDAPDGTNGKRPAATASSPQKSQALSPGERSRLSLGLDCGSPTWSVASISVEETGTSNGSPPPQPWKKAGVADLLGGTGARLPCYADEENCWLHHGRDQAQVSPPFPEPAQPCRKKPPLGDSNWLSRLDCGSPLLSRARKRMQKVVPATGTAGREVVVIDDSPVPVRREVIFIEASPMPACREVIVIEDSPM